MSGPKFCFPAYFFKMILKIQNAIQYIFNFIITIQINIGSVGFDDQNSVTNMFLHLRNALGNNES
jgi:hypothetical protein